MAFHTRNEQAMAQEKDLVEKQVAEWGVGVDVLYLQPGSTMVRILPAYSEAGLFFRKVIKHRVRSGGKTFVSACPAEMEGSYCPICTKAQELKDSGDQFKMKFAKDQLKPQVKYLYNVICYSAPADRQGKAKEFGKVYVMEAGIMVHKQLVSLDTDTMTGWVDITNLENGVNVVIKRTGSSLDTKYEVAPTGHGRSNVLVDLHARGFDTSKLEPNNLDLVYTIPPTEKLEEIVSGLQISISSAAPAFPIMQPAPPATFTAPPVVPVPQPATPTALVAPVGPPVVPTPPVVYTTGAGPQLVPVTTATGPQPVVAVAPPPIPKPPSSV